MGNLKVLPPMKNNAWWPHNRLNSLDLACGTTGCKIKIRWFRGEGLGMTLLQLHLSWSSRRKSGSVCLDLGLLLNSSRFMGHEVGSAASGFGKTYIAISRDVHFWGEGLSFWLLLKISLWLSCLSFAGPLLLVGLDSSGYPAELVSGNMCADSHSFPKTFVVGLWDIEARRPCRRNI